MHTDYWKVEVDESNITGAGKGLFATELILKDEIIGEYRGFLSEKFGDNTNRSLKFFDKEMYIDADDCPAGYANDSVHFRKYTFQETRELLLRNTLVYLHEHNAKYWEYGGRMFLMAVRDIQPGEEIYVSYGSNYWKSRLLDTGKLTFKRPKH